MHYKRYTIPSPSIILNHPFQTIKRRISSGSHASLMSLDQVSEKEVCEKSPKLVFGVQKLNSALNLGGASGAFEKMNIE